MTNFGDIVVHVQAEINDTSTAAATRVKRYINTILSQPYLGLKYSWNLNATAIAVASGATGVAFPATNQMGLFFNSSYDCDVLPKTRRQVEMYGSNDGIINQYWRQGAYLMFPQVDGAQTLYLEYYPAFGELSASATIPLCPDLDTVANGALWLAFARLNKRESAAFSEKMFLTGKAQLMDNEGVELVSFEDPSSYTQEG